MTLVPSLLQAIILMDGEALVLHVGDQPYVVVDNGQVNLANAPMTTAAISDVIDELLPPDSKRAFTDVGATQCVLPLYPSFPHERFSVVAARGGDDVWLEIRRTTLGMHKSDGPLPPAPAPVPDDVASVFDAPPIPELPPFESPIPEAEAVAPMLVLVPPPVQPDVPAIPELPSPFLVTERPAPFEDVPFVGAPLVDAPSVYAPFVEAPAAAHSQVPTDVWTPEPYFSPTPAPEPVPEPEPVVAAVSEPAWGPVAVAAEQTPAQAEPFIPPVVVEAPVVEPDVQPTVAVAPVTPEALPVRSPDVAVAPAHEPAPAPAAPEPVPAPAFVAAPAPAPAVVPAVAPAAAVAAALVHERRPEPPASVADYSLPRVQAHQAPVVVPMARPSVRLLVPNLPEPAASGLERLLRLAAARGATTLYLVSGSLPAVRIDDEVRPLDGADALESHELEAILLSLVPEQGSPLTGSAVSGEWTSDFDDLGRVRCLSFRDHRGPGCVFRLMPRQVPTSQQLGLSSDVQALAAESEGLIVVTGPRLSGKRTLMAAFVDQINRMRRAHVITIEHDISVVHDRAGSLVSQREVRDGERAADAARQALREDPDVLVLEDVHSAELVELALEAAAAGRLVICGFPARGASAAIDRMLELAPASERRRLQLLLARNLRAVVGQVLLRKVGGGRLPARELLLNTPAVSALLAEGRTSQLPVALEGGRRQGMVPMNDALAALVQSGAVEAAEAWRSSPDRAGLLTLLQRQGVDVSPLERLA